MSLLTPGLRKAGVVALPCVISLEPDLPHNPLTFDPG
jgi:hypothetical protein